MADLGTLQTIAQQKSEIESLQVEVNSINQQLHFHKKQLEEANERINVPDEFIFFRDKTKEAINTMQTRLNSVFCEFEDLKSTISDLKVICREIQEEVYGVSVQCDSLKESIQVKIQEQTQSRNELKERVDKQHALFKFDMDKKLTELSTKLSSIPSSIIESNQELLKKVDMAVLDGSNAMLKVNNTDTNMRILERKLENLGLQVKKLDLTQQSK